MSLELENSWAPVTAVLILNGATKIVSPISRSIAISYGFKRVYITIPKTLNTYQVDVELVCNNITTLKTISIEYYTD